MFTVSEELRIRCISDDDTMMQAFVTWHKRHIKGGEAEQQLEVLSLAQAALGAASVAVRYLMEHNLALQVCMLVRVCFQLVMPHRASDATVIWGTAGRNQRHGHRPNSEFHPKGGPDHEQ